MKIVLDHCVPKRLTRHLAAHYVRTARQMGWEGLKNGNLLTQAAGSFEVVVTVDQNIKNQRNPATLPISVVVLIAPSNRLADLIPLVPELERTLQQLKPRTLIEIRVPPP